MPKKTKYDQASLDNVLKEIRENSMSIKKASKNVGVPRSTLQDRIHARFVEGPTSFGAKTYLSKEEEQQIVDSLLHVAKCGFPRDKVDLLNAVQSIVKKQKIATPFKNRKHGRKGYQLFMARHPELAIRLPENISKGRAIITEKSIRKWFRDLEAYLYSVNAADILDDPTNGDETAFCLAPKSRAIIAAKEARNCYQVNMSKEKETLTVLMVFSACCKTLPPMVVFPSVRPPATIANSMPDDWVLGRSGSGWMTSETFYEYTAIGLNKYLLKQETKHPILMLVDGHKSHLSFA